MVELTDGPLSHGDLRGDRDDRAGGDGRAAAPDPERNSTPRHPLRGRSAAQQEADSVGKGAIVRQFVDRTDYKGKGGSYGSSVSAGFGRVVFPFAPDGSKPVAFSYGHFLNCSGCTKDADMDASYKAAALEKFRPPCGRR